MGRAGVAGLVAAMPAFGSDGLAMLGRCIEPTLGRWKLGVCTFGRCMFGIDGLACGIWGLACGMLGRAWGRACDMDGLACGICGRAAACPWFPPPPARPGMIRDAGGAAIAVEVWALPLAQVGAFLAMIPSPLGLGRVELADGRFAVGFLAEAAGVAGAEEITHLGGWRAFLAAQA